MVKFVSSFGRNGVHDYLLIRATGIIIALYTLYMVGFFVCESDVNYITWKLFFGQLFTKVFTMITLMAILIHAWIGMWQVLTDYIKPAVIRAALQLGIVLVLVGYFFFGLFILWGV